MTARLILAASLTLGALVAPLAATAAPPGNEHFPPDLNAPGGPSPPYSAAVLAGTTLYVSGAVDTDPATGKPPPDPADGARRVLDAVKREVEAGGMTMDDMVWVQVFATDLSTFAAFNTVYRGYFKGPLPARAFVGAGSLLGGAHFEVMGVAVKAGR